MVEALQKTDDQNEENGSNAIFRTYDRLKELRQQLNRFTNHYYLLAFLTLAALAVPAPDQYIRVALDLLALALWVKPMVQLLEKNQHIPKEISKEEAGLEAERRIAQAIQDTFKSQKVKIYSRLDENCLMAGQDKDIDVVAVFPNGKRFVISIKRRSKAKKVYIHADGRLRLSVPGKQVPFKHCPAQELIDQEKWLRQNRRLLLRTPGTTTILPSMRVLVFAAPTLVGEQEPHQYASIGDKKFVKIQRDKDFVYLLQEDQLCDFIQAVLKLK